MHKNYYKEFKGICSVLPTPFKENEDFDYQGFEKILRYQKQNQINTIFICGAGGEGPSISNDVRANSVKIALENFEESPISVGIFESGTKRTISSIEFLRKNVDLEDRIILTVSPPVYFSPMHTKQEIISFYREVGSLGIPVIAYSNPSYTGLKLDLETTKSLSQEENIFGMKFVKGSLDELRQLREGLDQKFNIGFANRSPLLESFNAGADVLVNSTASLVPKTFFELYQNYIKGDLNRAKDFEREIADFEEIFKIHKNYIAVSKSVLNLLLGSGDYLTKPFEKLPDSIKKEVEKFLGSKEMLR